MADMTKSIKAMGECIYLSNWSPRGVRKDWERCSIDADSASRALGQWVRGGVTDACGWFDKNDRLRILVADSDDGKRTTYRRSGLSFTIQTESRP